MKYALQLFFTLKLRNILKRTFLKRSEVYIVYDSLSSAEQTAATYNDPMIAAVVAQKTEYFVRNLGKMGIKPHEAQALMAIRDAIEQKRIEQVVEFGGGCGALAALYSHCYANSDIRWTIVETSEMVMQAEKLNLNNKIKFIKTDDFAESDRLKGALIVAQGVWQYLPHPLEHIKGLLRSDAVAIYFGRTAVHADNEQIITVQAVPYSAHGPGILTGDHVDLIGNQPLTFVSTNALDACLEHEKWSVHYRFDENQYAIHTTQGSKRILERGALLLRK